jgi:glucuronokinase
MIIETRAYARAGLLGNPSDGYFGKTISISVRNFGAHVSLYQTPELKIEPQIQDLHEYKNINDLVESVNLHGYYGGDRLIKASIKKFRDYCQLEGIRLESKNFTIRYLSTIPRQVGLAGSSAIITACMRALMQFFDVKISEKMLPSLVLSTEVDELGINAGLQDRVIQVYQGCVFMDFDKKYMEKHNYGRYVRLEPELLPKLYIAYRLDMGKESGVVLNDVKMRYDNGDTFVIETLEQIADVAARGRKALEQKEIMNIRDADLTLVQTARKCGASAKFAGSGGSIIGLYHDDEMLNHLKVELKKVKARVINPFIQ